MSDSFKALEFLQNLRQELTLLQSGLREAENELARMRATYTDYRESKKDYESRPNTGQQNDPVIAGYERDITDQTKKIQEIKAQIAGYEMEIAKFKMSGLPSDMN